MELYKHARGNNLQFQKFKHQKSFLAALQMMIQSNNLNAIIFFF